MESDCKTVVFETDVFRQKMHKIFKTTILSKISTEGEEEECELLVDNSLKLLVHNIIQKAFKNEKFYHDVFSKVIEQVNNNHLKVDSKFGYKILQRLRFYKKKAKFKKILAEEESAKDEDDYKDNKTTLEISDFKAIKNIFTN